MSDININQIRASMFEVLNSYEKNGEWNSLLDSGSFLIHLLGIESQGHILDIRVACEKAKLFIKNNDFHLYREELIANPDFKGFYKFRILK